MSGLSDRVRSAATIEPNGEVLWPFHVARDAINELADAGHVVLGLDAREKNDRGLATEVPISTCERAVTVEAARIAALAAFERSEVISGWVAPNILITW